MTAVEKGWELGAARGAGAERDHFPIGPMGPIQAQALGPLVVMRILLPLPLLLLPLLQPPRCPHHQTG